MAQSEQKRKGATAVCILQHIHCETLGLISDCLKSAGIKMRFVRTFAGNPVPSDLDAQVGLIVMGGPMSVYDHKQFPLSKTSIDWCESISTMDKIDSILTETNRNHLSFDKQSI